MVQLVCWACAVLLAEVAAPNHDDVTAVRSPFHWCDGCYAKTGWED